MEEISWISKGFSIRDVYWDPVSKKLLLSCGYQGVVVFQLDENMQIVEYTNRGLNVAFDKLVDIYNDIDNNK